MPATAIDLPEPAFPHEDVFVPSRVRELSGQLILRMDTNDSAIVFRVDLAARCKREDDDHEDDGRAVDTTARRRWHDPPGTRRRLHALGTIGGLADAVKKKG